MNSAKIEGGLVVNVAVGPVDVYIDCGSDVGIGWGYDGTVFTAPEPKPAIPPTVPEQIAALESTVTSRWLRGAALGDKYSIGKIQGVEDEILKLRK